MGWDRRNWLRIKQIESFEAELAKRGPDETVFEVSPGWNRYWRDRCAPNYHFANFPEFDIAREATKEQFDIVIADQVLEHVLDPVQAARNIRAMLKPGGTAMIATPFLFRVHARPHDYYRWTEPGLRQLLLNAGFSDDAIESHSWGNKACVRAHVGSDVKDFGFGRDLSNDPEYPIMVWAFARNL